MGPPEAETQDSVHHDAMNGGYGSLNPPGSKPTGAYPHLCHEWELPATIGLRKILVRSTDGSCASAEY